MFNVFPLTNDFDRIFDEFSKSIYKAEGGFPKYNIWTDDESAYISVAVTGIPEDKLKTYIDDEGYLVVQADVPKDTREYITKQYPIKSFKKRFIIDKYEVGTVIHENGELVIRLNKKSPIQKEIPILSGENLEAA